MKTLYEKEEIVKNMYGDTLFRYYTFLCQHFNPIDEDFCENHTLCKNEIIRRLQEYDKMKTEKKR